MNDLNDFIEEMKRKYDGEATVQSISVERVSLPEIPLPLREFYAAYESARFPFGEIWPLINDEEQRYFSELGWFCFGFDNYFSYWLCSFEPDADGMWFTSWDHDSDTDIEGVYGSMAEFLTAMEKEYAERN